MNFEAPTSKGGHPSAPRANAQPSPARADRFAGPATRAPIHLHIDQLIVEGLPFDWRQGAALQAAVESELARLFRRDGFAGAVSSAESDVAGGTIRLESGATTRAIGREIGRRVHAAVTPPNSSITSDTLAPGGMP